MPKPATVERTRLEDRGGERAYDGARQAPPAEQRATDLTADLLPGLPIAPGLAVLVHNTARLSGPVTNNVPSPYDNLNEWWCRDGRC